MSLPQQTVRRAAITLALLGVGACSSTGGLGSVLGSVLGQQQGTQVSGTVRRVDTRSQSIQIQQSTGETMYVLFDNQTQVVYQNRNYPVTSLENGDQVTARLQPNNNGGYYADLVQVDQSVNNGGNTTNSGNVQTLQGTVRQIDRNNGWFTVETGPNVLLTVSLPNNTSRADSDRFRNLRNGDVVRFYGAYLNQSRVELRQFY
jgi:hypothetical protein